MKSIKVVDVVFHSNKQNIGFLFTLMPTANRLIALIQDKSQRIKLQLEKDPKAVSPINLEFLDLCVERLIKHQAEQIVDEKGKMVAYKGIHLTITHRSLYDYV